MSKQLDRLYRAIMAMKPEELSTEDLARMEHILNIGANMEYEERHRRAITAIAMANKHDTRKVKKTARARPHDD